MPKFTNTRLWCVAYYIGVVVVGGCQPFMFLEDSSASFLSAIAIALPAVYWALGDAKMKGKHIPHIIQPAIVGYWFVAIPFYLLGTRKWWGIFYLLMHVVGTILASLAGQYVAVRFVWQLVFPDVGG